jgi:Secretory lipase
LVRTVLLAIVALVSFAAPAACEREQDRAPAARISPASRVLPLTEFYDTGDPLPAGKPGELIRAEPFDGYRLSYQVTAFRILYHSQSASGKDVAVSGVALFPEGMPPAGGWPIVAWAHGFSGSARQCAPSLRNNLDDGPLLSMYVGLRYAVVVSDYAGLGTNSSYAALDIRSNATDVIYAIAAARRAFPQLGKRWVVAGYALGALVAAGVAEAEESVGDVDYLGAIGIAGISEPRQFFARLAQGPSYPMAVFLGKGIKVLYPEFRVEDILTDQAMRLYQYANHSCDVGLAPVPEAREMWKPGWENNSYVQRFFDRETLGQKPAFGPLLVIAGQNDTAVPIKNTRNAVAQLCGQGDPVLLVEYPAANASETVGNSVSEQVSWIRARFSGLPPPSNCH